MSRSRFTWSERPPVLRALAAQGIIFLILLLLAHLGPFRLPSGAWIIAQGVGAALLAMKWGLGPWWRLFQLLLPFALAWQAVHHVPAWCYPTVVVLLLLIYGGGIWTRVPLYNSNRAAWEALLSFIPEDQSYQVVDLGAGLGGPLHFLAARRPASHFKGVEASPLVWLAAWLRTRNLRANCMIRLGSFWREDLGHFDVVYAFLSPAPMAELGQKAFAEMRPGSLLISHTFPIPGLQPEATLPLPGRPDACLLVYRIGQQAVFTES